MCPKCKALEISFASRQKENVWLFPFCSQHSPASSTLTPDCILMFFFLFLHFRSHSRASVSERWGMQLDIRILLVSSVWMSGKTHQGNRLFCHLLVGSGKACARPLRAQICMQQLNWTDLQIKWNESKHKWNVFLCVSTSDMFKTLNKQQQTKAFTHENTQTSVLKSLCAVQKMAVASDVL